MSDLLGRWAVYYAERGWPVHPLQAGTKRPVTEHGLHDATTDVERVRRWWERHPDHNVGIRTGVAFDALDFDEPAALDRFDAVAPVDAEVVVGPISLTANGCHLLVAPTGLGNRTGVVPGLDFRGVGGFVVAPPSRHPSGASYHWSKDYGVDTPIAPAPRWLEDLLPRRRHPDHPDDQRDHHQHDPVGDPGRRRPSSSYGRRAVEAECGRLACAPVGERNDQLNRSAHALGQLVAGEVLEAGVVVDELLLVARRIGLGDREAEATVASGLRGGMASPRRPAA